MKYLFDEDEMEALKNRLTLRFTFDGIHFDGRFYSWNEVEAIRADTQKSDAPITRMQMPDFHWR